MAQRGGARPGAGRKRGIASIEAEKMRSIMAEKLSQNFSPIIDKAVEQAMNGDGKAREWLTDHIIGKPAQGIELSNKNGEPFQIADEQYNQAVRAAAKRSSSDKSS